VTDRLARRQSRSGGPQALTHLLAALLWTFVLPIGQAAAQDAGAPNPDVASESSADAVSSTGENPADAGEAFEEAPDAADAAEAEVAGGPPPPPAAEVQARIDAARQRLEDLRALLAGSLPQTRRLADLFPFDITDQARVDERLLALSTEIAARQAGVVIAGRSDVGTAGDESGSAPGSETDVEFIPPAHAEPQGYDATEAPVESVADVVGGTDDDGSTDVRRIADTGETSGEDAADVDAGAAAPPDAQLDATVPAADASSATDAAGPEDAAANEASGPPYATPDQVEELRALELDSLQAEAALLRSSLDARQLLVRAQVQRDRIARELAEASLAAAAELRARIGGAQRMAAAIRVLIAGLLPEDLATSQLFSVAVTDETAVARRRTELQVEVAARVAQLGSMTEGNAPPGLDAGKLALVRELAQAELDLAESRLAFLERTPEQRAGVLDAEEEQRRLNLERQAAAADQDRASREAELAQAAREKALEEERRARTEVERAIARDRANAEGIRLEQARRREAAASQRGKALAAAQARLGRTYDIFEMLRTSPPTAAGADADARLDRVNGELDLALDEFETCFDALDALAPAPRYVPDPKLLEHLPAAFADQKAQALLLRDGIERTARELERDEREAARKRLAEAADWVVQLKRARLSVLARASETQRNVSFGWTRTGLDELGREFRVLGLQARWYVHRLPQRFGAAFGSLDDKFVLGRAALRLFGAVAALLAAFWLRRRVPGWLARAGAATERSLRGRPGLARRRLALLAIVEGVLTQGVLLAVVLSLPGVLGAAASAVPEVALGLDIAIWFAGYRMATALLERIVGWATRRYGTGMSKAIGRKLRRSLRFVGRYVFACGSVLALTTASLGDGVVKHQARFIVLLGFAAIGLVLFRWWQTDIADRYLVYRPKGRLADRVRATRDRRHGFLIAFIAFAAVAAVGTVRAVKRFVLGFEQTRKALAFLFRRRLEKRIGESAFRPAEAALPEDLAQALRDCPAGTDSCAAGPQLRLDDVREAFLRWRKGGVVGAVLAVARPGNGRTTWLRAAETLVEGVPKVQVRLDRRILTERELMVTLASAVGAPASSAPDLASLGAWLAGAEPRVVCVDDLERLMLRGIGTFAAWDALTRLVELAGDRVFWLGTIAADPFAFLSWTNRGVGAFRTAVKLGPWSEEQIAELIRSRTESAGYEVVYDDLLVERLEGTEAQSQRMNTGLQYLRLIWDYADGSPRVALHSWSASLLPDGDKRVRVRLFRRPDAERLEGLGEREKFLLACILWHDGLTPEQAARSLGCPVAACHDGLARLRDLGALEERDGWMHPTTEWLAPVRRFLVRKRLLES
jgi:hypothetical protein